MKRYIAFFMALLMMTVLLHGVAAADGAFPCTREELGLPELDIQGDTVTYLTWGSQKSFETDAANLLMQQLYGCKIKVVRTTWAEIAQKAATMVLSNNAPDLIQFRPQEYPSFIQNGIVADITNYLDFDDPLWAGMEASADVYRYKGRCYVFPYKQIYNNSVIYYWTSYFEDLGLETPLELYRSGNWNMESFRELMRELTLDDDRDGIVDVYGLVLHPDYSYLACGEDYAILDRETGLFSNNLRSPALARYFDFIYDTSTAGDDSRLMSLEAQTAFYAKNAVMHWYERWPMQSDYYEALMSGEMEFAPSPRLSDEGPNYVLGRLGEIWMGKDSANPQGALAYLSCIRALDMNDGLEEAVLAWFGLPSKALTQDMKALLKEMDDPESFTPLLPVSRGIGDWGTSMTGLLDLYSMAAQFENPWQTLVEHFYPILQEQIDIANRRAGEQ